MLLFAYSRAFGFASFCPAVKDLSTLQCPVAFPSVYHCPPSQALWGDGGAASLETWKSGEKGVGDFFWVKPKTPCLMWSHVKNVPFVISKLDFLFFLLSLFRQKFVLWTIKEWWLPLKSFNLYEESMEFLMVTVHRVKCRGSLDCSWFPSLKNCFLPHIWKPTGKQFVFCCNIAHGWLCSCFNS